MGVSIADRYIVKEILPPFLLGIGAFVVILIGDILYTLAEFIVTKRVSLDVMLRLLTLKVPAILVITFPVSTLLGTLLGLGRLAKDNEIQAMRLGGMSLARIFCPVLAFGVLMAGLTFSTNELIAPWANHRADNLIRRAVFGEAFPQVRQQIFFRGPENRFFYVDKVDDSAHLLRNVMIYEPSGVVPRLITARHARWDERTWSLADGVIREFDAEGFTRYEARFADMQILVGADAGTFFAGQRTPEEMTARELRQYLSVFGAGNVAHFAVEYYRKFAVPCASVIFALVAAPLSVHGTQGGRYKGVGLSIALLFFYYALMSTARALGGTGALAPALAAWLPNLVFGLGGLALWAREDRWLRHLRVPVPAVKYGTYS